MENLEATKTERRRQTRNSVYRCIYEAKNPISKQEIAQDLSLSLPTVHLNISELVAADLIQLGGLRESTGGRRANGYVIVETARFAVGISITDSALRFVATDLLLHEIAYKRLTRTDLQTGVDISVFAAAELEKFLDENGLNRTKLLGVGIALPAVIDQENLVITLSPTLHMSPHTPKNLIEHIPYPCRVDNDADSGGFAELFLRPDIKSVAYLSLENGVGGAVLLQGERYFGSNHRSGEFGHMCVEPGGLACKCGNRGCLEAYCSPTRISTDLGVSLEAFFEELANGNKTNQALWDDVLRHLALGVNNIRMALDCDVILGGELTEYMQPYLAELRALAAKLNPFEDNADYISLSILPRRAIMLGVTLSFIQLFIESI